MVYIDADGCPVVDITVQLCRRYHTKCRIFCDTAHELHREDAQTITIDKGADSVDFAIANRVKPKDLVITQDYGLASMCLAKGARVLHQDGWEYTDANIEALLFQRHESKKYRMAGGRIRGPQKRTRQQDAAFLTSLHAALKSLSE